MNEKGHMIWVNDVSAPCRAETVLPSEVPEFTQVRVAQSSYLCSIVFIIVCYLCSFSFGHCSNCLNSIYGF